MALWCFIIITFMFLSIIVVMHTGLPQAYLSKFITSKISDSFPAKITIGSIGGNFLWKLTLNDIKVDTDTSPKQRILSVSSIGIRYNLFNLFFNRNSSENIININISRPVVLINRDKDGIFNFSSLIPPKSQNPSSAEFPYKLNIQVNKGEINYTDYATPLQVQIKDTQVQAEYAHSMFKLFGVRGEVAGNSFFVSGNISLKESSPGIDIELAAANFDLASIDLVYPPAKAYKLEGMANLNITAKSVPGQSIPIIIGRISIPQASVYSYSIANISSAFEFNKQKISFLIDKGLIEKGTFKTEGTADFSGPQPAFNINGSLMGVDLQNLVGNTKIITGKADAVFQVKGSLKQNSIVLNIKGKNANAYGRSIIKADLKLDLNRGSVLLRKASIYTDKKGEIHATATLFKDKNFVTDLSLRSLSFDSTKIYISSMGSAQGYIDSDTRFSGRLSEQFFSSPLENIKVTSLSNIKEIDLSYVITSNSEAIAQSIDLLSFNLSWDGKLLSADKITLREKETRLFGSGFFALDKSYLFKFKGAPIMLENFDSIIAGKGVASGPIVIQGEVSGILPSWNLMLDFDVKSPSYKGLVIDKIKGSLLKKQSMLEIANMEISNNKDLYIIGGKINLPNYQKVDLNLEIKKGSVKNIITLIRDGVKVAGIYKSEHVFDSLAGLDEKALTQILSINASHNINESIPVYNENQNTITHLKSFITDTTTTANEKKNDNKQSLIDDLTGDISGKLSFNNLTSNVLMGADIGIKNLKLAESTFGSIEIKAESTPGPIVSSVVVRDGLVGGTSFEEVSAQLLYDQDKTLIIESVTMKLHGYKNIKIISGIVPLAELFGPVENPKALSLNIEIAGNQIAIVSLFTNAIESATNEGALIFNIGGSVKKPILKKGLISIINGRLNLKKGLFPVASFVIPEVDIRVKDNVASINAFSLSWEGDKKLKKTNLISARGSVGLRLAPSKETTSFVINTDIKMDDTDLYLNIPDLCIGMLKIRETSFKGDYFFSLSKSDKGIEAPLKNGLLLKSKLELYETVLSIPKISKKSKLFPSILIDIEFTMGKNVLLSGGVVPEGVLSGFINNIDIYFDKSPHQLMIGGSLNRYSIEGNLFFRYGTIVLLNKDFTLMSQSEQEKYFGRSKDLAKPNYIEFRKEDTAPLLHLRAMTETDVAQTEVGSSLGQREVFIFVIDGTVTDVSNMYIYQFHRQGSTFTPDEGNPIVIGRMSVVQLEKLSTYLWPELLSVSFYQNLANEGLQGESAGIFIRQLSERAVNNIVYRQLRPVEREIADRIGVDDIHFNYNLGNIISDGSSDNNNGKQDLVGVDISSRLFIDRLYVTVRTNLDRQENDKTLSVGISQYELKLSLLEWLSLIYHNKTIFSDNRSEGVFALEAEYNF